MREGGLCAVGVGSSADWKPGLAGRVQRSPGVAGEPREQEAQRQLAPDADSTRSHRDGRCLAGLELSMITVLPSLAFPLLPLQRSQETGWSRVR